ncbi:MAG TPA: lysophospholipid acyltransferase family protein, partial [Polyangiaceae bacterium]|nr:lysophospholipid acyltransferase family protein [Polyangiaceae bacterium]
MANPILRRMWSLAQPALEWAAGLEALAAKYEKAAVESTVEGFLSRILLELDIGWDSSDLDLARIPRAGGCVLVANHPFGAIEGIVLASMLRGVRKDVKLLANYLLARIEPLRELMVFVDPFGGPGSAASNLSALRDAVRFLRKGGLLAVFPAGEVAHWDRKTGKIVDPPWSPGLARLVRLAEVPALAVHFAGQNGPLFQAAGMVHPRLRTALLPRELLNKKGRQVDVRVGAVIPHRKLAAFTSDTEMVDYLRNRTAILGQRRPAASRSFEDRLRSMAKPAMTALALRTAPRLPVADPVAPELLVKE